MIAKALRKNTICPTGATSPRWRTSADITANSKAETILKATPLNTFINVSHRARQCIVGENPARFPRLPSETKVLPAGTRDWECSGLTPRGQAPGQIRRNDYSPNSPAEWHRPRQVRIQ